MRLQELHPALVHFPIALLPVALATDALGSLLRDDSLHEVGRCGMALVAGGGAIAAVSGLAAQHAVDADHPAYDVLITHRTLNVGALVVTSALALSRAPASRPGAGYFTAGLAALGLTVYSAYLGGRMVYEHGVGVKPAGHFHEARAPELRSGWTAARAMLHNVRHGFQNAVEDLRHGTLVPSVRRLRGTGTPASHDDGVASPNDRA